MVYITVKKTSSGIVAKPTPSLSDRRAQLRRNKSAVERRKAASAYANPIPIEDAPKTFEAAMEQYADRKNKEAAANQQQQESAQQYFLTVGEKRVQVSKGLYDKVISDKKKAEVSKPYYAVTSRGATYAETGETVKSAQIKADKENAFQFLAPVEKFVADKNVKVNIFGKELNIKGLGLGDKERIYKTVITTKQKLARESDIAGQQAKKYWWIDEKGNQLGSGEYLKALPYRTKELSAEFKSGAFNMISAPVETAALFIATKSLTKSGATASPYASRGVGAPALISVYGTVRDKDAGKGVARTIGEASVFVGLNAASNKVTNVFKQKVLRNELKVVGESGATRTFKTAQGETFSKTKSNTRIVGQKTDYSVRSELTQKTIPQGKIQNIGKTTGKLNIYETKGNKFIGSANVDARSITNTQSQKSLSFIKVTQNNKISNYMDYSQYKSIGNAKTADLNILYKAKSFSVNNAYAAKPIQITKGTSQEIFSQNLYTESGASVGTKSRSMFLKIGLKKDAGISDLFKFDINTPPKSNFVAASNNIGTSQTTKTASNLVLQQSLGKEVVIKQIVAQETTKPFIYPLFSTKTKQVIKTSSQTTKTKSPKPSVVTKQNPQIPKSMTVITTRSKPKQNIVSVPRETTKAKTEIKSFVAYKPIQIVETAIDTVQETRQKQKPITNQITRQKQDYITTPITTPSYSVPESYGFYYSFIGKPKGIDLPYREFGSKQMPKGQIGFKSKYVPSLEAEIFKIKGKRSRFAEISGIGLRAITKTGGI